MVTRYRIRGNRSSSTEPPEKIQLVTNIYEHALFDLVVAFPDP